MSAVLIELFRNVELERGAWHLVLAPRSWHRFNSSAQFRTAAQLERGAWHLVLAPRSWHRFDSSAQFRTAAPWWVRNVELDQGVWHHRGRHFQFGAYGTKHVFVWAGPAHRGIEDALEEAASWLADNAPGMFTDVGSEEDEVDMTYTESGWLASWEWHVHELHAGDDLYAQVWEASVDHLATEGDLDDDDIENVNATAATLDLDTAWELD